MSHDSKITQALQKSNLDAFLVQKGCNLQYLTGFTGGEGLAVILSSGDCSLLVDGRYTYQARTQSYPQINVLEYHHKTLWETLNQLMLNCKRIGLESETPLNLYQRLQEKISPKEWIHQADFFEQIRIIKTSDEIEKLKKAANIANEAYLAILSQIREGVSELELSGLLEYEMKKRGGQKVSFDVIVASGERSAMPHGVATEKKISAGDIITFDFGVFYQGYVSDTTRTVCLGKPLDPEAEKIYGIVLDAQLKAIEAVKENVTCSAIDALARSHIEEKGYGALFKHSTGHGIGLEIHELPRISSECSIMLQEGMAITVEPGIYIDHRFGIRIEDSLIVTKNGYINLTSLEKNKLQIL